MRKPFVLPPSPMRDLLFVMTCVAAGFFLVLKVGFLLHHDVPPPILKSLALTNVTTLVLGVGVVAAILQLLRWGQRAWAIARFRREARKNAARYTEARRLRVLELAADPARAKYAPLVKAGETWSDDDIAYAESPDQTVTCAHLCAIEKALRQARIPVRRYGEASVSADCWIDFDELQRTFSITPPVRYAEFFAGERSSEDHPMAFLRCDEHAAMIHTLHPAQGGKKIRWFPASHQAK